MKKSLLMLGLMLFMASCIAQKPMKMNTERLTYFSFDHHNSMVMFSGEKYNVSAMKDGRIHIVFDEGLPNESEFYLGDTATIFDELTVIVKQFQMDRYLNNYQPEMFITDGDSWSLYYKYDSGRSVSSGGYMAWPDNYREARTAIHEYFQKWRDLLPKNVSFFEFTCHNNSGRNIVYRLQRINKDRIILQMRDAERNLDEMYPVDNSYTQQIQEFVDAHGLKDCSEDKSSDKNATQYKYHIRYTNGETFDMEGCYNSSMGSKETALMELFNSWLSEK